jgi:hypothetical protein
VFSNLAHPTDGSTPQFADLHIGVVTSDYGAGTIDEGNCTATPGGQKGILQATAAKGTTLAGCAGPTSGLFIQYKFDSSGADTCNLPGGACTATSLNTTFTCMASVGARGCGFEHQLESVYAALKDTTNNAGFLRYDALLAVVFVTNEDDGSAPPGSTFYNAPATLSASDPNVLQFGTWDTYRQTHFGVACGNPLALAPESASNGVLACEPVPSASVQLGSEYDVQRYIDLFNDPLGTGSGIKSDPSSIILVALDAPDSMMETELVKPLTGCGAVGPGCNSATYEACATGETDCIVRLTHSCQNSADPAFFGDPALRLNTVIRTVNPPPAPEKPAIFSICGDDTTVEPDYTSTLTAVAQRIVSQLKPPCIPAPLLHPDTPECVVQDVTTTAGKVTTTQYQRCDTVNDLPPCYSVVEDAVDCPCVQGSDGMPRHPSISITRKDPVPPNTVVKVSCTTEALTSYTCN